MSDYWMAVSFNLIADMFVHDYDAVEGIENEMPKVVFFSSWQNPFWKKKWFENSNHFFFSKPLIFQNHFLALWTTVVQSITPPPYSSVPYRFHTALGPVWGLPGSLVRVAASPGGTACHSAAVCCSHTGTPRFSPSAPRCTSADLRVENI